MWPFTTKKKPKTKTKDDELLKRSASPPTTSDSTSPTEKKRETGLYQRADVESRAREALRKHQDAMSRSAFLDAVVERQVKEAQDETDEAVAEVQRRHEQISSVLNPKNGKTAQQLALEALEEEEANR